MKPDDRIILFATGVLFPQTVFDTLVGKNIIPVAIVLPSYPPAPINKLPGVKIDHHPDFNKFTGKALKLSIPIIYAPAENKNNLSLQLSSIQPDYILVACWPYLLSAAVTGLARKAALNIHPSLLPSYRGANPIDDQLAHGESELGVTLHLLSEKFDQGDILAQERIYFSSGYPGKKEIEIEAAKIGAGLFIDTIKKYASPDWSPYKQ